MMAPGMEAPFTIYFKQPNKMRMEFELQGMKAIQAYDGESGWSVMPFMGNPDPQKMSEDELKNARRMADFEGPLVDWQNKGHKVELVGQEDVDGTPAYKVKVVEYGDTSFLYLDAEQFLEFQQVSTITTQQGAEIRMITNYGDYKRAGDIVVAHSVEMTAEGAPQGQVVTIKKVEINVDTADDLFKMPAPAAKPAQSGN
jgi:outer membrane lipoprotein-sorting protein